MKVNNYVSHLHSMIYLALDIYEHTMWSNEQILRTRYQSNNSSKTLIKKIIFIQIDQKMLTRLGLDIIYLYF